VQIETPMAEALGKYLDLSSLQLKLTAQNMANIDTPGYRTEGFDFASEMTRSMQALSGVSGSGASASGGDAQADANTGAGLGDVRVAQVGGLLERPDGNNVSMDREGMKMAEAQLQFRTGVELLKHEFTRVLDAIHEDK
jgi:flagellar basal-body rod protein FlgB